LVITILQRWQTLFNQLEVIDRGNSVTSSKAELLAFEAATGIILPLGYKEFCQVFGWGTFGNFVDIYGKPNMELSEELIEYLKIELKQLKKWDSFLNLEATETLLNSAFMFGGTSRRESFLWDLRTYSESDQSYDIYLARLGHLPVYLVGRDFIEFVRDFCLGMKAFEVLPQEMWPSPKELSLTFSR
jgi:hypothetical protein